MGKGIIHTNSILSNRQTDKMKRREEIFEAYRHFNGGCTDRAIAAYLGYNDLNAVKPRITEMIQDGILEECGNTLDRTTNRTVRVVQIKVRAFSQPEFAFKT